MSVVPIHIGKNFTCESLSQLKIHPDFKKGTYTNYAKVAIALKHNQAI